MSLISPTRIEQTWWLQNSLASLFNKTESFKLRTHKKHRDTEVSRVPREPALI